MNPTDAIFPPQDLSVMHPPHNLRLGIFKKLLLAIAMIATSGWIYLLWKAASFIGRSMFA
jgi:hypothetical protein